MYHNIQKRTYAFWLFVELPSNQVPASSRMVYADAVAVSPTAVWHTCSRHATRSARPKPLVKAWCAPCWMRYAIRSACAASGRMCARRGVSRVDAVGIWQLLCVYHAVVTFKSRENFNKFVCVCVLIMSQVIIIRIFLKLFVS